MADTNTAPPATFKGKQIFGAHITAGGQLMALFLTGDEKVLLTEAQTTQHFEAGELNMDTVRITGMRHLAERVEQSATEIAKKKLDREYEILAEGLEEAARLVREYKGMPGLGYLRGALHASKPINAIEKFQMRAIPLAAQLDAEAGQL